jgi:phage gp36-like protein
MYCDQAAFSARFGSDEFDQLLPGGDDREYEAAAADADALIDAYLAARYAVPLSPVPDLILGIAADLTRHELYEEKPTEEVEARRALAMELLEQLRDGALAMPGVTVAATGVGVAVAARTQVFTEDLGGAYVGCL